METTLTIIEQALAEGIIDAIEADEYDIYKPLEFDMGKYFAVVFCRLREDWKHVGPSEDMLVPGYSTIQEVNFFLYSFLLYDEDGTRIYMKDPLRYHLIEDVVEKEVYKYLKNTY